MLDFTFSLCHFVDLFLLIRSYFKAYQLRKLMFCWGAFNLCLLKVEHACCHSASRPERFVSNLLCRVLDSDNSCLISWITNFFDCAQKILPESLWKTTFTCNPQTRSPFFQEETWIYSIISLLGDCNFDLVSFSINWNKLKKKKGCHFCIWANLCKYFGVKMW